MRDYVDLVAILLTAAALGYNVVGLRRDPGAATRRWMCVLLVGLLLAVAAKQAWVADGLNSLGAANVASLAQFGGVIISCLGVQLVLLNIYRPARAAAAVRPLLWLFGAVMTGYTVLFLLAAEPRSSRYYFSVFAGNGFVVAHAGVLLGYLAATYVLIAYVNWRCSHTELPMLRWGTRIVVLGAVDGLCFCFSLGFNVVAVHLGWRAPGPDPQFVQASEQAVVVLCVVGVLLPALDPYLAARRAWRGLEPLSRAFAEVAPHDERDGPDRGARARLYRRVIAIRDGQLALRPYVDGRVAELAAERARAAGLPDRQCRAVTEAAVTAAAIQALREGREPAGDGDTPAFAVDVDSYESEVSWLVEVSRAYGALESTVDSDLRKKTLR